MVLNIENKEKVTWNDTGKSVLNTMPGSDYAYIEEVTWALL